MKREGAERKLFYRLLTKADEIERRGGRVVKEKLMSPEIKKKAKTNENITNDSHNRMSWNPLQHKGFSLEKMCLPPSSTS